MIELAKLEVFLRGGAFATLLLCGALFALRARKTRKHLIIAALCGALRAYILVSSPGIGIGQGIVFMMLAPVAATVPVLVYWAALTLFLDEMRWAAWQAAICVIIVGAAWLSFASISLGAVRGLCVLVLFAHLVSVIALGDAGDLVAARRRFRRGFLITISVTAIIVTGIELSGLDGALPAIAYLLHALVFWALAAVFLLLAVQVDASL